MRLPDHTVLELNLLSSSLVKYIYIYKYDCPVVNLCFKVLSLQRTLRHLY